MISIRVGRRNANVFVSAEFTGVADHERRIVLVVVDPPVFVFLLQSAFEKATIPVLRFDFWQVVKDVVATKIGCLRCESLEIRSNAAKVAAVIPADRNFERAVVGPHQNEIDGIVVDGGS